jgi:hypothetical protein
MRDATFKTNPIVILDGPDCAGKSTLAQAIQRLTGAAVLHQTYKPEWHILDYHLCTTAAAGFLAGHRWVVLDRLWKSEWVYHSVFRSHAETDYCMRSVIQVLGELTVINVDCLPHDRKQYLDHFNSVRTQRQEMYPVRADEVYDGFVEISEIAPCDYQYDMFVHAPDAFAQMILEEHTPHVH